MRNSYNNGFDVEGDDDFEEEEEELLDEEEEELLDEDLKFDGEDDTAQEYCRRKHRNLMGWKERESREWHQLEVQIRDEGLADTIASCKRYLEKSQTDPGRFDQRSYDTKVTIEFLEYAGEY